MKNTLIALGVAVAIGAAGGYYFTDSHYQAKIAAYKQAKETAEKDALNAKSNAESEARKRVNAIETEYLIKLNNQKADYEKTIDDLRRGVNLNGVYDGTGSGEHLPGAGDDSAQFVCYKREELLRRIEKTLAIGRDANELAMKHLALVKVCTKP